MATLTEQDASEVIEADAEVEGDMLGDEELDAAFEAEHGDYFKVLDEVGEAGDDRHSRERSRLEEQNRFVIPKVRADNEGARGASNAEASKHERSRSDRTVGRSRHLDRGAEKRSLREHDKDERSKPRDHDSSRRDKGHRSERETSKDRRPSSDRRDKPKNSGESRSLTDCQNGDRKPIVSKSEDRISLFDSFAAEGLISDNALLHSQLAQKISEQSQAQQSQPVKVESASNLSSEDLLDKDSEKKTEEVALTNPVIEEGPLEIPMGRDSLVFVREFFSWQVRVYPIEKKDMTRADFASVWSMVDSSSVVWSTSPDFGGVAEFLLKDHDSIQKFTRKILWYTFSAETLIVEITERNKADPVTAADVEALEVMNHATIRFDNAKARQLIKTYYPSPQGEVTERSLYINNVAAGVSTDIVKAIFPCALKITVPKAGKDMGSFPAIVEVESEGATFNYLVVYGPIRINGQDLVLSSVKHDWQGAKAKFAENASEKGKAGKQPLLKGTLEEKKTTRTQPPQHGKKSPATALPPGAAKRPSSEMTRKGAPAKRGRASPPGNGPASASAGRSLLGSRPRGALLPCPGAAPPGMGMGRGLLPKPKQQIPPSEPVPLLPDPLMDEEAYYNEPMLGSDALLPTPQGPPYGCQPPSLLSIPMRPTREGILEADFMLSGVTEDLERRTAELKEMHHKLENKVLETRASLMRASRQHFSEEDEDMDLRHPQREAPRLSLLETPMSSDNQPFRDDMPPRRPDSYLPPPRRLLNEDSQMRRQPVDDIPPPLPPPPLPPRRAGVEFLQRRPVALLEDPGVRRESAPRRYLEEEEKPLRSELPPPKRGILKERPRSSHGELEDVNLNVYRRSRYPPPEVTEQDLSYSRETRRLDSNYNERATAASSYMFDQPATHEEEEDGGGYDYEEDRGGYARSSRSELPDLGPHERRLLLRSIAEPDRSSEPAQRSREEYDYDQLDSRRLPSYTAGHSYEDEDRRSTPMKRYREDYDEYDRRY